MRRAFLLAILVAAPALAGEADDRLAIMRAILALNEVPLRQSIFTPEASVDAEFHLLWSGRPFQIATIQRLPGGKPEAPSIQISHEPWGEATIGLPAVRFEVTNPRIVTEAVHFITGDVAVVDGASLYDGGNGRERVRLVLILSRRGGEWKIGALRVVSAK